MGSRKRPDDPRSLLDAIDEEIAEARGSTTTGAIPIDTNVGKKRIETLQESVVRVARKPRTLVLLVLLLAAVIELAAVTWTQDASEVIAQQNAGALPAPLLKSAAQPGHTEPALPTEPADASAPADASSSADARVTSDAAAHPGQ
jgi:hypothetical protein